MARPTKYSDAIANAICDTLQVGGTRTAAVGIAGITYETFLNWIERNLDFRSAVTRAEAEAEMRYTEAIAKAAKGTEDSPGDWRAAEAWLKRRRREDWGDAIKQEVSGDADKPLTVKVVSGVSMADL